MKINSCPASVTTAMLAMAMLAWAAGCQEPQQPQGPAQPSPEAGGIDQSPLPGSGVQPDNQSPPGNQSGQLPGAGSYQSQPQEEGPSNIPSSSRFEGELPAKANADGDGSSFSLENEADADAAFPNSAADSPGSFGADNGDDGASNGIK